MSRRRVVLIAEGPSDLRRIRVLLDHFFQSRTTGANSLEELRWFEGLSGEEYIQIKKIPEMVRKLGLPRYYPSGGPNRGDAGTLRKVLQVLQKEKLLAPGNVILWARDDDGDDARRANAEAVRIAHQADAPLLLAIASECGEAWAIAGWRPRTPSEEAKRKIWRQQLGFAPHEQPHRLSHKENVPRSAKTVASDLFDDEEAEADALRAAAKLDNPAVRDCGLRAFCIEVDACLSSGAIQPPGDTLPSPG